jgi:hypothetical protein
MFPDGGWPTPTQSRLNMVASPRQPCGPLRSLAPPLATGLSLSRRPCFDLMNASSWENLQSAQLYAFTPIHGRRKLVDGGYIPPPRRAQRFCPPRALHLRRPYHTQTSPAGPSTGLLSGGSYSGLTPPPAVLRSAEDQSRAPAVSHVCSPCARAGGSISPCRGQTGATQDRGGV